MPTLDNDVRNDMVDAWGAHADGGTLELRSGDAPENLDDPASGTLLASLDLEDPAFQAASEGTKQANGLPLETTGLDDGEVGHYRVLDVDDAARWHSSSVGTTDSGANMILNTTTISEGVAVSVDDWTITQPAS